MPLPFQPNCQPTSLGLLPHTDVERAWSVMLNHVPAIPSVPMPVGPGESLAGIGVQGFAGVDGAAGMVLDREAALRGLDALYAAYLRGAADTRALELAALSFLQRSEQPWLRRCRAVFGTLIGPISLALMLADQQGVPLAADPVLLDALAQHLFLRQLWLHQTLRRIGKPVVVWMYEPFGAALQSAYLPGTPATFYAALDQALGNETPRALWLSDIVSAGGLFETVPIDLLGVPLPPAATAAEVAGHISQLIATRRGIAWGIVPATAAGVRSTSVGRLAARFEEWSQALEGYGISATDLAAASLVMSEDTLMYLEPAEAEHALALTAELASVLQQSFGID
jgi:hypothetical protein